MADNKDTNKKASRKSKYNSKQQDAINDSIRAIKQYYGPDVDPKVINSILGNIELETAGFTKLREDAYTWKNMEDGQGSSSMTKNWKDWQAKGGTRKQYEDLSKGERLSVTYWGDTEHAGSAGGSGAVHLTSANYNGLEGTDELLRKTVDDLGLDYNTVNQSFFDSTLATLHLYKKYRNQDFSQYDTPEDLRQNIINSGEKLNPKKEGQKAKIDLLKSYSEDPFDTSGDFTGDQSIDPSLITSDKNIDQGAQEELLKVNESEGLQQRTADDLVQGQSILDQYTGYTGAQDLRNYIVDDNKAQQVANPQVGPQQEPVQDGPQVNTPIEAFGSDFNLLNQQFAKGGQLDNLAGKNVLTEYNEGGAHEANPNGGVPVGPNQGGGQNLVEQGETRHNDYIYSNDYQLSKEDALRFNISPRYVGKPYSDISKDINSQMKDRPYDRLVKQTAEGNLNKLMMSQEAVKAMEQTAQQGPPMGAQQFKVGGDLDPAKKTSAFGEMSGSEQAGAVVGAAGTAMSLGMKAFGDSGVDTTGAGGRQEVGSVGGAAASGAMQGAAAGASFGPWGAAIGGVVGGGLGAIGGGKAKRDAAEANNNAALVENNQFRTNFAKGGALDPPTKNPFSRGIFDQEAWRNMGSAMVDGMKTENRVPNLGKYLNGTSDELPVPTATATRQPADEIQSYPSSKSQVSQPAVFEKPDNYDYYNDPEGIMKKNQAPANGGVEDFETEVTARPKATAVNSLLGNHGLVDKSGFGTMEQSSKFSESSKEGHEAHYKDPAADEADPNTSVQGFQAQELLRYAPTLGNIAQYLTLPDAEVESYDRLDNRYQPQLMDEMAMQNRASQSAANTRNAIGNFSGGSQAAARASLLGSQVNETRGLSEAYLQADQVNRNENKAGQEFNLGVDNMNQQIDTAETVANAQNRAARESRKQQLMQSALNDMGEIGREQMLTRTVGNLSGGYNPDGTKRGSDEAIGFFSGMFNRKHEKGGALEIAKKIFG